jgi:hypothetical protein
MSFNLGFMRGWHQHQAFDQLERERFAELSKPFPGNPPELLAPTRVKVLRPFCVGGKPLAIGTTTTLPRADADSLVAIGKVQLLKE